MSDCHNDKKIDALIGKNVKVILKQNNKEYIGRLQECDFGFGYIVECYNQDYNLRFYKSHIKSIERIRI